jgi:thiamine-phosphate pyrophosphorylase
MPLSKAKMRPAPRLYVVTPPIGGSASSRATGVEAAAEFSQSWAQALRGVDAAAVLLRLVDADERSLINAIKAAAPVQDAGAALLVDGRADLVARGGGDGAHLIGLDALRVALPQLKPDRIAGAGGIESRHDAMVAGEAGADYVMFGEPDADGTRPGLAAVVDWVAWWAELFEIPCVAYAGGLDEIEPLAAAGADFIALGAALFRDSRGLESALADAAARLAVAEGVA